MPLNEEAELKPLSLYAKHKVEIEKYIISQKSSKNFSPTILRFSTAFGLSSRMRYDLTINQFTKSIYFKEKLDVSTQKRGGLTVMLKIWYCFRDSAFGRKKTY